MDAVEILRWTFPPSSGPHRLIPFNLWRKDGTQRPPTADELQRWGLI